MHQIHSVYFSLEFLIGFFCVSISLAQLCFVIDIDFNSSILTQLLNLLRPTITRKYLRIQLIVTQTDKLKFDWNSSSHCSGARKSCIERGNLSSQFLNLVRGHILTTRPPSWIHDGINGCVSWFAAEVAAKRVVRVPHTTDSKGKLLDTERRDSSLSLI